MIEVVMPSVLTTIQDLGRRGWQAYGVPVSGPMDFIAQRAANMLVSNSPQAATLEIGYSSAEFIAWQDCLIAVTGAGFSLRIANRRMPLWTSIFVRKRWRIEIEKVGDGNWAYLAAQGGFRTPPALGSRSSYLPARLGAPALAPGDALHLGPTLDKPLSLLAAATFTSIPVEYTTNPVIAVLPGPQAHYFTPAALAALQDSPYHISRRSDRTGYRLDGPPLERAIPGELLSEGMARGCIQVPADGLPIIMQADCPTVGGYPKIASVITADQPLLAQTPVEAGQIRFAEVTVEQAHARYQALMRQLNERFSPPEPEEYYA